MADQIKELEEELSHYREEAERYERTCNSLQLTCNSLQDDNKALAEAWAEAEAFIEYIDKTHPELRTAYEAISKLEGAKI